MATLQLRVVSSFNNPSLPVSTIGSKLYRSSALGIWEMLDGYDRSGKGNSLIQMGLGFDSTGLYCDGVANHYVDTGVVEPDAYTIITAVQADIPAQTSQIWSCLPEGAAPYTGARAAVTSTGAYLATISSSATGGITNLTTGVVAPVWDIFAYTVRNEQLRMTRGSSMGTLTADITGRKKSSKTIRIGGGYLSPHNIGIKGHIGTFALYNGVLSDSDISTLITTTRQIMAGRGISA